MEELMISTLLRDLRSQSEQIGRLRGDMQAMEARHKSDMKQDRSWVSERLRGLERDLSELRRKTAVPLWKQLWAEWYIRLILLIGLGLANIDLKQALGVILQIK